MKEIEVKISLDPVNDGADIIDSDFEVKDRGSLIIATNGERKRAGIDETVDYLSRLMKNSYGEFIGKTPYILIINSEKIFKAECGTYFIGSAVIMKDEEKGKGLELLSGDEFEKAAKAFEERLVVITAGGKDYSAYELC